MKKVAEEKSRAGEFEGEDMDTPEDTAWRESILATSLKSNSAEKFDIEAGIRAWLNSGKGRGNWGHKGVPGQRGGSADRDMPNERPSEFTDSNSLLIYAKNNGMHVTYTNTKYPIATMRNYLRNPNARLFQLRDNQTGKTVARLTRKQPGGAHNHILSVEWLTGDLLK